MLAGVDENQPAGVVLQQQLDDSPLSQAQRNTLLHACARLRRGAEALYEWVSKSLFDRLCERVMIVASKITMKCNAGHAIHSKCSGHTHKRCARHSQWQLAVQPMTVESTPALLAAVRGTLKVGTDVPASFQKQLCETVQGLNERAYKVLLLLAAVCLSAVACCNGTCFQSGISLSGREAL